MLFLLVVGALVGAVTYYFWETRCVRWMGQVGTTAALVSYWGLLWGGFMLCRSAVSWDLLSLSIGIGGPGVVLGRIAPGVLAHYRHGRAAAEAGERLETSSVTQSAKVPWARRLGRMLARR
jgi:hypothetical protein